MNKHCYIKCRLSQKGCKSNYLMNRMIVEKVH